MSENKRRPHYDLIIAWAEGKDIQGRASSSTPWSDYTRPAFHALWEYRVKPETAKYKRFLWSSTFYLRTAPTVLTVTPDQQKNEPRETWQGFIRWIDNDWQEVEV